MKKIVLYFMLLGVLAQTVFAQYGSLKGRIADQAGMPLEAANVYLEGTVIGAATDRDGEFSIMKIPAGNYRLRVAMVGFRLYEMQVTIEEGSVHLDDILLMPVALQSQPIVVTAARHDQVIQDLSVSVSSVTAKEIEYRNNTTVEEALQYISGLNMTGSQLNIRGSSGYSRGVGSRVLMLIDGMPFMTGDTKETNFASIQIDQVERIEVVKGAGSALYGSNAIGGVINVIQKKIEERPVTDFQLYGGLFSPTHYDEWKWTDASRHLFGGRINYSDRAGNIGYRIGISHEQNESYKKNDWMKRNYLSTMLEWDWSAQDELRIAATLLDNRHASFLYWKDLNNALIPPDDQIGNIVESRRWHLMTNFRHIFDQHRFYTLKAIWYQNHFQDNIDAGEGRAGNRSTSDYWNGEFQYTFARGSHQMTSGINLDVSKVSSDIFSNKTAYNGALFIQDELSLSGTWTVTPGLRLDYFELQEVGSEIQINPKLATVLRPVDGAAIRASIGRGFRAPSIAEVFTNTTASGLKVIPNPHLEPERSFSGEIGYNQFAGEKIFFDMAVFYNRFWNLIEAAFTETGEIQFRNVTDAELFGSEFNFNLSAFNDQILYSLGYTYVDAVNLATNNYLTFRPRHLIYNQIRFDWNGFFVGADYRFINAWDRIDQSLSVFVDNAESRVDAHILDLRTGTTVQLEDSEIDITMQINNLLQYHYLDLVGSIAPTRHFVVTVGGTF